MTTKVSIRKITPGLYWIMGCVNVDQMKTEDSEDEWYVPGREIHTSNNAFLIVGEKSFLWETLSPANREGVVKALKDILGDRPLDYVAVSHTEAPHGGNATAIMEAFPQSTLVASAHGHHHEMYHLEDAMRVAQGDEINLGDGFVVDFVKAVFADTPMSIWMSERKMNTLFTVDYFGIPHMDSECVKFIDEIENGITVDRLAAFHLPAFQWLRFADPERTDDLIDYIIETYDPDILAPTHGNIIREDPSKYTEQVKQMIAPIKEQNRTSVVFE